jgi:hypothetical protein
MPRPNPPINGEVLYKARVDLGLTRLQVKALTAERVEALTAEAGCGIDDSNLRRLELGTTAHPRPMTVKVLGEVLHLTREQMFAACAGCGNPWSAACLDHEDSPAEDDPASGALRPDAECAGCGKPWSATHSCTGTPALAS